MRIWVTSTWSFESRETDVGCNGNLHPTWGLSEGPTWAQTGCQGLNITQLSVTNRSGAFSSARADLIFTRRWHLARFCPLVSFLLVLKAASTSGNISFGFGLVCLDFSFSLLEISWFHGDLSSLPSHTQILVGFRLNYSTEKWRGQRGAQHGVVFKAWFGGLSALTAVDRRVVVSGSHRCKVECFYLLPCEFQYLYLLYIFSVDFILHGFISTYQ